MSAQNVSQEKWLEFIKSIHKHIGFHLIEFFGLKSGRYIENMNLFRWHPGCSLKDDLESFLSSGEFSDEVLKKFCKWLESKYNYPRADFRDFINIILRVSGDESITISRSHIPALPKAHKLEKGVYMLNKLYVAYVTDKLASTDKRRVNKIVKFGIPYEQVPAAMNDLANKLVEDLQNLDVQDIDAVVKFVSELFYELVDVHPFPNANGRTATCLINVMLSAMGYPSILLRNPGDNEDSSSLYSRAIASIDDSREPLMRLVKSRIISAQEKSFADDELEIIALERVKLAHAYTQIHAEFPRFDVNAHIHKSSLNASSEGTPVEVLTWMVNTANAQITALRQAINRAQSQQSLLNSGLAKEAQAALIAKLQKLSGIDSGWKSYKKVSVILLEHSSREKTVEICELLNRTNACKAVATALKSNAAVYVVQVSDINVSEFLSLPEVEVSLADANCKA